MTTDAERFLSALGGRFTFQTFDDGKGKRRNLIRILHGTLVEQASTLAALNDKGAGVFVMVNEGDGKHRNADSVRRVRAYFVDLDGAPLDPVKDAPLQPHILIASSPSRWHAYWLVKDAPLTTFRAVQKALAERFQADPKVCDLPRVMRLPGFMHRKREPFQTHIVTLRDAPPYAHAAFVDAFGIDGRASNVTPLPTTRKRRRLPDVIPEGERNATLLSLAAGLVRDGHNPQAINGRLQRVNAERCLPPLDACEVDDIAARAVGYGSEGFTTLPHTLLDSPEWKALPPAAHDVILTAFRRYNGFNNGNIALTWADFDGHEGFTKKDTFYRHRKRAIESGILRVQAAGGNTQRGRKPDLFAIAPEWIRFASPEKRDRRQSPKSRPLHR